MKGLTQDNHNPGTSSSSSTGKPHAPRPKISRPLAPLGRDLVPSLKHPQSAPPPPQSYHQDNDDIQELQPNIKSKPVSALAEVVPQQQQQAGRMEMLRALCKTTSSYLKRDGASANNVGNWKVRKICGIIGTHISTTFLP